MQFKLPALIKRLGHRLALQRIHAGQTTLAGLIQFDGLGRINTVSGDLSVIYNPRLETLEGLRFLALIERNLIVLENPALERLGLQRLRQVFDGVYIAGNDMLPNCEICDLIYILEGYRLDGVPLPMAVRNSSGDVICDD